MIRVIIADDHPLVRRGLMETLEDEHDIQVVAEAACGRAALDAAMKPDWDVLVLDLSMPGMSGLEIIDQLHRQRPGSAILVLSMHPEEQFAVHALQAGALGYLNKEAAATGLVAGVRAVAAGRRYVSEALAEILADRLAGDDARPAHEKLSARELQVLCLLARGESTQEIGEALCLSPKTVATYRARIKDKTGLDTIAALTRYALQHHLIA